MVVVGENLKMAGWLSWNAFLLNFKVGTKEYFRISAIVSELCKKEDDERCHRMVEAAGVGF